MFLLVYFIIILASIQNTFCWQPNKLNSTDVQKIKVRINDVDNEALKKAILVLIKHKKIAKDFAASIKKLYNSKLKGYLMHRITLVRVSERYKDYAKEWDKEHEKIAAEVDRLLALGVNANIRAVFGLGEDFIAKCDYLAARDDKEYTEEESYDEIDRQSMWQYFNDPQWPRDFYPHRMHFVDAANGYYLSIHNLKIDSSYKAKHGENVLTDENYEHYLNADPFDPEENFYVNDKVVKKNLFYHFLEPYWSRYDKLYFLNVEQEKKYHMDFYQDTINYLLKEGLTGSRHRFQQCIDRNLVEEHYSDALGVLIESNEILRQLHFNHKKPFNMTNAAYMLERLVSAYYFSLENFEVKENSPAHLKFAVRNNNILRSRWSKDFRWFNIVFTARPHRAQRLEKYKKMLNNSRQKARKEAKKLSMEFVNDQMAEYCWKTLNDAKTKKPTEPKAITEEELLKAYAELNRKWDAEREEDLQNEDELDDDDDDYY